MKIESVKLVDINPYYNNPRDNSRAVSPVAESIKRYGFVKPIICDKDNVIIAGHTRYVAAFQLGLEYVPVVYSDMDEEKAKLFRIADNKLAEKSGFDEDKLIEELRALDVPEIMQAFFFEDVKGMLNFAYNDFAPVSTDYYNQEGDAEEVVFESNKGAENRSYEESFDIEEDAGSIEDEFSNEFVDKELNKAEVHSEYDDLYKLKLVDGKKVMKVVCPYCGNIETIEVE